MKRNGRYILFAAVLVVAVLGILGAAYLQDSPKAAPAISGINELVLDGQDLRLLGMASNGTDCLVEEYQTSEYSPLAQYGVCYYAIDGLDDSEVIIELKKFTNFNDLNGSYQYESSHLYGAKGLISENDYGDQSRFRVSNEDDYGAEFNEPGVYYYHLYFTKNEYLVHITSKGSESAGDYIARTGRRILSKFA